MKKNIISIFLVVALLFILTPTNSDAGRRGCKGSQNCTACTSCSGCKHCAKQGGTCGVCYTPPKKVKKKKLRNEKSIKKAKKSKNEERFSELILKVDKGLTLSNSEIEELDRIAEKIGIYIEVTIDKSNKKKRRCVYICNNGFMCNPDSPPPNCNCHKVCY